MVSGVFSSCFVLTVHLLPNRALWELQLMLIERKTFFFFFTISFHISSTPVSLKISTFLASLLLIYLSSIRDYFSHLLMYIVKFVMFYSLGFSCDDFHFLLYFDSHLSLVSCLVLLPPSCLNCHHQLFPLPLLVGTVFLCIYCPLLLPCCVVLFLCVFPGLLVLWMLYLSFVFVFVFRGFFLFVCLFILL